MGYFFSFIIFFTRLSDFFFKLNCDVQFISTHPTSRQRTLIHRSTNWYFSHFFPFYSVTELINSEL